MKEQQKNATPQGETSTALALRPHAEFSKMLDMMPPDISAVGKVLQSNIRTGLEAVPANMETGGTAAEAAGTPEGTPKAKGADGASVPEADGTPETEGTPKEETGDGDGDGEGVPGIESPDYWFPRFSVDEWNTILELSYLTNTTPAETIHDTLFAANLIPSLVEAIKAREAQGEAQGEETGEGEAGESVPTPPSGQPAHALCKPIPQPPHSGLTLSPFPFCENGEDFDKTAGGEEIGLSRMDASRAVPCMVGLSFNAAIRPFNLLRKDGAWILAFDFAPVCECEGAPMFGVKVGDGGDIPLETALALLGGDNTAVK